MNPEIMKNGWEALNEQLTNNEIVSNRIIKELVKTRTYSAYDKVWRAHCRNALSNLVVGTVIPLMTYMNGAIQMSTFILLELFMLLTAGCQLYLTRLLSKFDTCGMTPDSMLGALLRYRQAELGFRKYGAAGAVIIILTCFIIENSFGLYTLTATAIMLVLGVISLPVAIKRHNRRISELEDGLNELREFEN